MSEQQYISDIIGEEYKNWHWGDIILITAPTGSGKSFFVMHNLLEEAIQQGRPILYLVNRKILKLQLEKELKTKIFSNLRNKYNGLILNNYIAIMTYQSIEERLKKGEIQSLCYELCRYQYIVYDECHYFIADSTFNTSTVLSYTFLTECFDYKVQIFISATMDNLKRYLNCSIIECNTMVKGTDDPKFAELKRYRRQNNFFKEYNIEKNYDYIRLHSITDDKDIPDLIKNSKPNKKWLIFVDSLIKGKNLEKDLIDKKIIEKDNIIFIDAEYKTDENAYKDVQELSQNKIISKQVVISTSVMDNGISFHDINLSNIIIFTDTEEEFIQMLGRKRYDDEFINLYICKRNIKYFSSRKNNIDNILMCYNKYEYLNINIYNYNRQPIAQEKSLNNMITDSETYNCMRKFCFFQNGYVYINPFSIDRLTSNRIFYEDMYSKLKEDENVFLKEQARWLNRNPDDIEEFINLSNEEITNHAINSIKNIIEENYLEKELDKDENTKMAKQIKDYIDYLLKTKNGFSEDEIKSIRGGLKSDRPLSNKNFNMFMEKFSSELPYIMEKPTRNTFIIKRRDINS